MSHFIYILTPVRSSLSSDATEEERAILQLHFNYLSNLCEHGTVVLAGRTEQGDMGLVILEKEGEEDARVLMDQDPAVQKGIMKAVLSPFRLALERQK